MIKQFSFMEPVRKDGTSAFPGLISPGSKPVIKTMDPVSEKPVSEEKYKEAEEKPKRVLKGTKTRKLL
jgi:hypothetical protein